MYNEVAPRNQEDKVKVWSTNVTVRQIRGAPKQLQHNIKKVLVTEERLQRDSSLCERYKETIMTYIKNGKLAPFLGSLKMEQKDLVFASPPSL